MLRLEQSGVVKQSGAVGHSSLEEAAREMTPLTPPHSRFLPLSSEKGSGEKSPSTAILSDSGTQGREGRSPAWGWAACAGLEPTA